MTKLQGIEESCIKDNHLFVKNNQKNKKIVKMIAFRGNSGNSGGDEGGDGVLNSKSPGE